MAVIFQAVGLPCAPVDSNQRSRKVGWASFLADMTDYSSRISTGALAVLTLEVRTEAADSEVAQMGDGSRIAD